MTSPTITANTNICFSIYSLNPLHQHTLMSPIYCQLNVSFNIPSFTNLRYSAIKHLTKMILNFLPNCATRVKILKSTVSSVLVHFFLFMSYHFLPPPPYTHKLAPTIQVLLNCSASNTTPATFCKSTYDNQSAPLAHSIICSTPIRAYCTEKTLKCPWSNVTMCLQFINTCKSS